MLELLAIVVGVAFFPVGLGLMWLGRGPAPERDTTQPLDTGPAEPCWSEEIGRNGPFRLARAHCPHDLLMELDARAARGDFPLMELNRTAC